MQRRGKPASVWEEWLVLQTQDTFPWATGRPSTWALGLENEFLEVVGWQGLRLVVGMVPLIVSFLGTEDQIFTLSSFQ